MSEIIELYINEVHELKESDGVELIGDDVTGHHKDNGILIYKYHVTLVRKNILANASLYKMNIYLAGEAILNLKFESEELLNKTYNLLK